MRDMGTWTWTSSLFLFACVDAHEYVVYVHNYMKIEDEFLWNMKCRFPREGEISEERILRQRKEVRRTNELNRIEWN